MEGKRSNKALDFLLFIRYHLVKGGRIVVRMRLAIMALALCSCSANPKYDCMSAVDAKELYV